MKKSIAIILFLIGFVAFSFAQQNNNDFSTIDAADPNKVGVDTAEQRIKEVSIEKFETEGTWYAMMSADEGVVRARLFNGNPLNKNRFQQKKDLSLQMKSSGCKSFFYRRGYNSFEVHATKALPVEGIAKLRVFGL